MNRKMGRGDEFGHEVSDCSAFTASSGEVKEDLGSYQIVVVVVDATTVECSYKIIPNVFTNKLNPKVEDFLNKAQLCFY